MPGARKQSALEHEKAEEEAKSALRFLKEQGVPYLVHFTSMKNLPNIFAEGLIPRDILEEKSVSFQYNDEKRHEGKECVNLSFTFPNSEYFYKCRKKHPDRNYVVLTIKLDILVDESVVTEKGCRYTAKNAASTDSMPCNIEGLFSGDRSNRLPDELPNDEQAEALVPCVIDPSYISSVQISHSEADLSDQIFAEIKKNGLQCNVNINDEFFELHPRRSDTLEQTKKFDSIAVHKNELEMIDHRACYQWTMRFLGALTADHRDDSALSAIAVMEKIINRGRITILSKELEGCLNRNEIGRAHQIQSVFVELVKQHILKPEMSLYFEDPSLPDNDLLDIAEKSLDDLKKLCSNISAMYGCMNFLENLRVLPTSESADLLIRWGSGTEALQQNEIEILPVQCVEANSDFDFTRVQKPVDINIDESILEFFLQYIFRFDSFRPNQINGIIRGLEGKDSIVLLPTGSGKSIVFQLLSLIMPGVAFVVSPILSLIDDQIENLQNIGIDRVVGLSSQLDTKEKYAVINELSSGQYLMCYVAPERFQDRKFKNTVEYYARFNIVSVIAIDEAHCVSEWGHEFRTSYLGLAQTCRDICKTGDATPPLLALTGTASSSVLTDIQNDLNISDNSAIIQPDSFDRPEIHYRVISTLSANKPKALEAIVNEFIPEDFNQTKDEFYSLDKPKGKRNCGIVFCPHANGSYGLMSSRAQLSSGYKGVWDQMIGMISRDQCGMYSGKAPDRWVEESEEEKKSNDWDEAKRGYASEFKKDEKTVMVATNAFGMGIDKPNIRWIIHYGMPGSLEAYYQEVGRAARDTNTAYAYLILSDDFAPMNREILNPAETNVEAIAEKEKKKKKGEKWVDDDISRFLYFHTKTFKGVEDEIRAAKRILADCGHQNFKNGQWWVPFKNNDKSTRERAVYRFNLLGVFESYSIDYSFNGDGCFVIDPTNKSGKELRDALTKNYLDYIRLYQSDDDYLKLAKNSLLEAVKDIDEDPKFDREFIIEVLSHLLKNFTYEVIEEGRRRAILTMLEAATKASTAYATDGKNAADDALREELLAYLSIEKKEEENSLQSIRNNATKISTILNIIEANPSENAWRDLAGQTARLLEAYPQHYGFYLIRTIETLLLGEYVQCVSSLKAAIEFGQSSYGVPPKRCLDDFVKCMNTKIASRLTAEELDEVIPDIANLFKIDEMDLICRLKSKQADILREINQMVSIVSCIEEGRKWKQAN